MTPIVFLDLDGVLNHQDWFARRSKVHTDVMAARVAQNVDPDCVRWLNEITDRTGARIVMSSTWRHLAPLSVLADGLRGRGMTGALIGRTPLATEHDPRVFERYRGRLPAAMEPYPRGYEIQQWLDACPSPPPFVILDDDGDMEHLLPWLVRTDFELGGLKREHAMRAIELLSEQSPQNDG